MVNVNEAFEVRLRVAGNIFEVLVDFDKYREFMKKPDEVDIYDVLADRKIYADQKRGEVASENLIKNIFEKKSEDEILKEILLKGECQIPTSYLNQLRQEKKQQVINYIVENATNPGMGNAKFTSSMIESEVSKIKHNFDIHQSAESQAKEVIEKLKKNMPITISKTVLEIVIPPSFVGSFYGSFRNMGRIMVEKYDRNGNLCLRMEVTSSKVDDVIDFVKKKSAGSAEYHIVK
ncbi:MAG: ribosome assembly factor SBDS [Nanoarchaeota archaeon]